MALIAGGAGKGGSRPPPLSSSSSSFPGARAAAAAAAAAAVVAALSAMASCFRRLPYAMIVDADAAMRLAVRNRARTHHVPVAVRWVERGRPVSGGMDD